MNAFIITAQDSPGELAKVAEAISERGINITSLACIAWAGTGGVALITNDESGTRSALSAGGLDMREVEILPHALEDRPGALAAVARMLADAGINIDLVLATGQREGKTTVAFATSDNARARQLIGTPAGAIA